MSAMTSVRPREAGGGFTFEPLAVLDEIDRELAAAEQRKKEPKAEGKRRGAATAAAAPATPPPPETAAAAPAAASAPAAAPQPTETVWILQLQGEGWNEAFLPTIERVERVIETCGDPSRSYKSRLERDVTATVNFLAEHCGLTRDAASQVIDEASLWQKTKEGRPLIDRRRRKRVLRNVAGIIAILAQVGVPLSHVGALFQRDPQMLLLRAGEGGRSVGESRVGDGVDVVWETRVVALAAFHYLNGHTNVPEDWPVDAGMAKWIERQNFMASRGMLGMTKRRQLMRAGLDLGLVTPEWEAAFDTMLEFHAVTGHFDAPAELRLAVANGAEDSEGNTAGELYHTKLDRSALPATLAEFIGNLRAKRDCLPEAVRTRLDRLGFTWDAAERPSGVLATNDVVCDAMVNDAMYTSPLASAWHPPAAEDSPTAMAGGAAATAEEDVMWDEVVALMPSVAGDPASPDTPGPSVEDAGSDAHPVPSNWGTRMRLHDMQQSARETRDILGSLDMIDEEWNRV